LDDRGAIVLVRHAGIFRTAYIFSCLTLFACGAGDNHRVANINNLKLPDVPVFPHQANFLASYCLSHVFPGKDAPERKACLRENKKRKHTHFYVYPYNENDYSQWGAPGFDYYEDPQAFRDLLLEIVDAGMGPVVWLFPDDAPNLHLNTTVSGYREILSNLIPVIDNEVNSYVLGLELDEYFSEIEIEKIGAHLDSLTDKKIGLHFSPGLTTGIENAWADYLIYQYGFGKTEGQIRSETQAVLDVIYNQYGKPLVAGEYSLFSTSPESEAIRLGDAAMSADPLMKSFGFGNGGSPLIR
jgi:hypothetical protein